MSDVNVLLILFILLIIGSIIILIVGRASYNEKINNEVKYDNAETSINDININEYIEREKEDLLVIQNIAENDIRIVNESIDIIENTKNIHILLDRKQDVIDATERLNSYVDINVNISQTIEGEIKEVRNEDFPFVFKSIINKEILRIAKFQFELLKEDILKLKQKQAKEKRCIKTFEILQLCFDNIEDVLNKDETVNSINEIINMAEEIYSDSQLS